MNETNYGSTENLLALLCHLNDEILELGVTDPEGVDILSSIREGVINEIRKRGLK